MTAKNRKKTGNAGEEAARCYLLKSGYKLLAKNYRTPLGEIDIIACKDQSIVFVEVKTRRSTSYGRPEEAVTSAKRKKISRIAHAYLEARGLSGYNARFDVISVIINDSGDLSIEHYKNAFWDASGYC